MTTQTRIFIIAMAAVLAITAGFSTAQANEAYVGQAYSLEKGNYAALVEGEKVRIQAALEIKVISDELNQIPVSFGSAEILDLKLSGSSAVLAVENDQYWVRVNRKGTVRLNATLMVPLTRNSDQEGFYLEIPQAVFSFCTVTIPRASVQLISDYAVGGTTQVRAGQTVITLPLGLKRQAQIFWTVRPVQEEAKTTEPVEPVYLANVQLLGTLEEETFRALATVDLHLLQGELKTVLFEIPSGWTVTGVRGGSGISDWKAEPAESSQQITVVFDQPFKQGNLRLLIDAEQPLSSSSDSVSLPSLIVVGAKRLTGQLALATATAIELKEPVMEGVKRIDVRELQAELRAQANAPVVAAFRYMEAPYRVMTQLIRPEELPVLVAIAESGELITVAAPTGEIITRAVYQIRNNKKTTLSVTLPTGSTLWSVLVDQRPVKPSAGPRGQIQVPIMNNHGPETVFPVEIVYVQKTTAMRPFFGQVQYEGPSLDIPVTVSQWKLLLPDRLMKIGYSGNVQFGFSAQMVSPEWRGIASAGIRNGEPQPLDSRRMSVLCEKAAPAAQSFADCEPMEQKDFEEAVDKVQQTGLLPFRVSIPQSGRVYRFGRLLSVNEPMSVQIRYLRMSLVPLASGGVVFLGLMALAGAARLFRRAK
jgi:hypothetical protein